MSDGRSVRIATRGSDLALAQTRGVAERIRATLGLQAELVVLETSGDRLQEISLAKVGGKGLFVKEIEEALLAGDADLAVHSAKDLPAIVAPQFALAAFPERADPRDALVGRAPDASLAALGRGARVGTGSARRRAQLLEQRPDLEVVGLRGNVPTRLRKLESEGLDAVILACAGLDRLGLGERIGERIDTQTMLPAVCQGTLALQTRAQDPLAEALAKLDDPVARTATVAERSFLERLEGDCNVPLAAHADVPGPGRLRLQGLVASLDGASVARAEEEVVLPAEAGAVFAAAKQLGLRVAERVLGAGGAALLAALRAEA